MLADLPPPALAWPVFRSRALAEAWHLGIVPPGDDELRREYIFRCAQIAALAAWAASEHQYDQHNLRGSR